MRRQKHKIAAFIAASLIGSSSLGVNAQYIESSTFFLDLTPKQIYYGYLYPNKILYMPFLNNYKFFDKAEYNFVEKPQLKYGVDFSEIRAKYPNRPFVKKVLTEDIQEFLNEKEIESGIPGAVIISQSIWEVGWNLSTPKGNGKDSLNLFNIKNCDGNYVVMAGSRWQCYDSYKASIEAYIELISTEPRYQKAYEHIKNGGDFATYYRLLGDAGYYEASKDEYTKNCISIINYNNLLLNKTKEF